jgi:dihydrofolate reductase
MSIDGFIADPDGGTSWMVWDWGDQWTWDDELKKYFNDLTASVDCVLLSRKMAVQGFVNHWAKAAEDPDPQWAFARKVTEVKKVVFTKTLDKSEWDNTDLAKGDLVNEVNRLKNRSGKDIIVYGGATLIAGLIEHNLIDEYHLFINPVVLGSGMTPFTGIGKKLRLISATPYECGVTVLCYRPAKG